MDDGGNFVVAWVEYDGSFVVKVSRFNAAGAELEAGQVVSSSANPSHPKLVNAANGDIFVAWSTYNLPQSDVAGVIFDAVNGTWGTEFLLNSITAGTQEFSGLGNAVAVDSTGDFIATWQSYDMANNSMTVFARRFHADGSAPESEFQVSAGIVKGDRYIY